MLSDKRGERENYSRRNLLTTVLKKLISYDPQVLNYISEFRFLTLTVVATPESDIHSLKNRVDMTGKTSYNARN